LLRRQGMSTHVSVAERIAYGKPLDPYSDRARVQVEPRAGTALAGRVLLSAIFLVSGFAKITDPAGSIGFMQSQGIPAAGILVYVAGLAELLGGLALASGFLTRVGAIGLILFMVPTTLIFHDFWTLTGEEQRHQMVQFMKNLAIIGGLLMVIAYGAGRYSVDGKVRKPMQP
jgi:putative oxidoreductase